MMHHCGVTSAHLSRKFSYNSEITSTASGDFLFSCVDQIAEQKFLNFSRLAVNQDGIDEALIARNSIFNLKFANRKSVHYRGFRKKKVHYSV